MVQNKNNKKDLKVKWLLSIIGIFFIFSILYSLLSVDAYYTNINRYFDDSRKADGFYGFALERTSDEFIVDGCGTGTMLDTVTGICWDKNMNHNGATLKWANNSAFNEPIWDNGTKVYSYPSGKANYPAFAYCEDLDLGGNTDWRLPSLNELHTLIDLIGTSGETCTTLTNFGFSNCQNYYWAYEEWKPSTSYAWRVIFSNGEDYYFADKVFSTSYVVCVR